MRHRQSPRLAFLVVLLAATLIAGIVITDGARKRDRAASPTRPGRLSRAPASPATVFVQEPYLGVSCPKSNSIACDRVGVSVWLARPATVAATIAGAPFRLNDPNWSYVAHQGGRPLYVYAGFLQPAGITTRLHVVPSGRSTWLGAYAPTPLVRFRIDYGHGAVVTTQERVRLHAGWG